MIATTIASNSCTIMPPSLTYLSYLPFFPLTTTMLCLYNQDLHEIVDSQVVSELRQIISVSSYELYYIRSETRLERVNWPICSFLLE